MAKTTATSPEAQLARRVARDLQLRERRTAKALLFAEARTLVLYRQVIKQATDALVAVHARGGTPLGHVQNQIANIQHGLHQTTREGQVGARAAGRRRLEIDAGRTLHAAPGTGPADDSRSASVAFTLAAAWGAAAIQTFDAEGVTARDISKLTQLIDHRLRRTAATEVARAFNGERRALYDEISSIADEGVPALKIWSSILDGLTCPTCFEADGEVVPARLDFSAGEPPLHVNCLPPGSPIRTPSGAQPIESLQVGDLVVGGLTGEPRRVVQVHRNPFEGNLVCICSAGRTIRLTPNHPVLTQRGWVDAGEVVLADHLFCEFGESGIGHSDCRTGETKDSPARCNEVLVLELVDCGLGWCRVPMAGVDLDGVLSLRQSEIDVPRSNGELRDHRETAASQRLEEAALDHGRRLGGPSRCESAKPLMRCLASAHRIVRSAGQSLAAVFSLSSHSNDIRLACAPKREPHSTEMASQDIPGHSELRGCGFERDLVVDVELSKQLLIDDDAVAVAQRLPVATAGRRTSSSETPAWNRGFDTAIATTDPPDGARRGGIPADNEKTSESLLGKIDKRHGLNLMPVSCRASRIDSLSREPYSGEVFNIGVDVDESYRADSLVVHNCRCITELFALPEDVDNIDLFRDELRQLIRDGRSTAKPGRRALPPKTAATPRPNQPTPQIEFIPHPNAHRTETTIMVDVKAVDRAWQRDTGFYIPPGGGGAEIGGRRAGVVEFLKTGKPVQASRVNYDAKTGRISFTDGRHRFSVLRDMGVDRVAITLPKRELRSLPSEWKAVALPNVPALQTKPADDRRSLPFQFGFTKEDLKRLEPGAQATGNISRVTRQLFGNQCPTVEGWRQLFEPPPGYRLAFKAFEESGKELTVRARILNPEGRDIGVIVRTFAKGSTGLVVSHEILELPNKADRGHGVAKSINRAALQGYRDMGVKRVLVTAALEDGPVVWAKQGFSWAYNDPYYETRFREFLVSKGIDGSKAAEGARVALEGAFRVADYTHDGKPLGVEFLKSLGSWSGGLSLDDNDPGYQYAKKKLDL